MNDEITIANRARWEAEVRKKGGFTVPWLDLDRDDILKYAEGRLDPISYELYQIYPAYLLKDVADKDVLCLAAGGGQQSAVFGLLDANVTVIDFTQGQLDGDITAAKHYGYPVKTLRLNMRDLSAIEDASFDFVYQGPSMSWVPSVHEIYTGVSRIIRPGGWYRVDFGNPANHSLEWDGEYYRVTEPYSERIYRYSDGAFDFRHYLSDIFNGLLENGFRIEHVEERPWTQPDIEATPGSWTHQMAYNVSFAVIAKKEI
ncbi:MAG: methyltransferase domain-containing protein [Candidatus Poribacteria bacterium]|nr:methyltransferase domain-containing protein [Candidatus Poribacteria bacterium]